MSQQIRASTPLPAAKLIAPMAAPMTGQNRASVMTKSELASIFPDFATVTQTACLLNIRMPPKHSAKEAKKGIIATEATALRASGTTS